MYTHIEIEDKGQDFTTIITDSDGVIVETRPFQTQFWKGGAIPIQDKDMFKVGELLPINHPPHINYGFLRYKIEGIEQKETI